MTPNRRFLMWKYYRHHTPCYDIVPGQVLHVMKIAADRTSANYLEYTLPTAVVIRVEPELVDSACCDTKWASVIYCDTAIKAWHPGWFRETNCRNCPHFTEPSELTRALKSTGIVIRSMK